MRTCLIALLLMCSSLAAQERPLRFAISDSWAMPMIRIEDGVATGGILFDLQQRLAEKVGRQADLLVLPRLRIAQMMTRSQLDVRCYVNPEWLKDSHHQYIWSVPFMLQRDLLVSRINQSPVELEELQGERIGTVLGFVYPKLEPYFVSGQLQREDARTQDQVLAKLSAGRYAYAVSSELALNWVNRQQPDDKRLYPVSELAADAVSCIVRDQPDVPSMALLRAMVQMKQDGEFEQILARYR
jgi:polar amino acid transport system substrate-binding protein